MTSPGLMADPLGRFSVVGIRPTILRGSLSNAQALIVPNTLAAPAMSYFISSIMAGGLSEMPPESKVMPLPINTMGALLP